MSNNLNELVNALGNELGEAEEKPPRKLATAAKKIIGYMITNPDFRMHTSDKDLEKLVEIYIKKINAYLEDL